MVFGTVTLACQECRSPFTVAGHLFNHRQNVQYCSNECRLIALNRLPKHNAGKGTARFVSPRGYIRISRDGRQQFEHRYVMEQHLGRKLTRAERVHHLNGDRADNRIENLELFASQREHLQQRHPETVNANLERAREALALQQSRSPQISEPLLQTRLAL